MNPGFIIEASAHAQALEAMLRLRDPKHVPELSCVAYRFGDGRLELSYTDTVCEIRHSAACDTSGSGGFLLHREAAQLMARTKAGDIEVQTDNIDNIAVNMSATKIRPQTLSIDNAQSLDEVEEQAVEFEVLAPLLSQALGHVKFAISKDQSRHQFNGVNFHCGPDMIGGVEENRLVLLASNGHVLGRAAIASELRGVDFTPFTVPDTAIESLQRMLSDESGNVTIRYQPSRVAFQCGSSTFTTKLIDGIWPDFSNYFPTDDTPSMEVDRKEYRDALQRFIFASKEQPRITHNFESGELELIARSEAYGLTRCVLPAFYDGPSIAKVFSQQLLLPLVTSCPGENLEFRTDNSGGALLVQPKSRPTGLHLQYLAMPQRVHAETWCSEMQEAA